MVGGTPQKGGTLTVLSNQDFTHLDPARNWVMSDMEFGTRLLYRTLVTYKAAPGTGAVNSSRTSRPTSAPPPTAPRPGPSASSRE